MSSCLRSVRLWSDIHGYSYKLIGDEFFNHVPEWFVKKVNGQRHLVADLARLELANQYLQEGWDKVIWVDADVYIVNPKLFIPDINEPYLFCRELWMTLRDNQIVLSERVNNSICVLSKNNDFLNFYRSTCMRIVKHASELTHTSIGTRFLTNIKDALPLIQNAIVLSPMLLKAFYENNENLIVHYKKSFGDPIYAINLCLTFRNHTYHDLLFNDEVYQEIISRLHQWLMPPNSDK